MDTSFLAGGAMTWPAFVAFGVFVVALLKGWDALVARFTSGTSAAVSPLQLDLVNVKLGLERQGQELNAFKVEVARTYVTGDVITRLEGRIDGMISSVQNEMRATRKELLDAVLGSRPHQ